MLFLTTPGRRPPQPPRREHAVVVGASMAGLMTARVLSGHFARVTVLDRDPLPPGTRLRRGVPQACHGHALLASGSHVVESLFPGVVEELVAGGAPLFTDFSQAHLELLGHRMVRTPYPFPEVMLQSERATLEQTLRDRVRQLPGVSLRDGVDVGALLYDEERRSVRGVRTASAAGEEDLECDLVVDTSGRSARAGAWLQQIGVPPPPEDGLDVGVIYVSQYVRLPADTPLPRFVLVGPRPGRAYGTALFRYEDDTWVWTVATIATRTLEVTRAAMLEVAREVLPTDLAEVVAASEPLTEPVRFRYPATRRRHFEKVRDFPSGLLVLGDAWCSFNPIYGQGMSVAGKEAVELDKALAGGDADLARRYFAAAVKHVDAAWALATSSDLALPEVEAPRPRSVVAVNAYVDRVLRAAESDTAVAHAFLRVIWLVAPPSSLFHPRVLTRVLRRRTAGRHDEAAVATSRTEASRTP